MTKRVWDYPRLAAMPIVSDPRRKGKEIVVVVWESARRLSIICFCAKSLKHKDRVGCRHIDFVLSVMSPWHRARTRMDEAVPARPDDVLGLVKGANNMNEPNATSERASD